MFIKTKIALAAAIVFGVASSALANDKDYDVGGFQPQTWEEIQKANKTAGSVGSAAYGFEAPSHKQVLPRKKPQRRAD
jgi:hypothetical protein